MTVPRLESGENIFEVLREKFNALADAVEQDDQATILVLLKELNMSSTLLNRCVNDAYTWAHER